MAERSILVDEAPEYTTRHAAEWGLASLIMGSVVVIIAPVTLLLNIWLWVFRRDVIPPEHLRLAYNGLLGGIILVFVLALLGIVFGIRGLVLAAVRYQPAGLAAAGIIVSTIALFLWIFVSIDLIMIMEGMMRLFNK